MNEPLDRNKTAITHVATAAVVGWLDGLGCKPIETEVPACVGWVLDVATFWEPTLSEAKRSRLLKNLCEQGIIDDAKDAFHNFIRQTGGRITVGVEVKTSRPDFLKDYGRKYGGHQKLATMKQPTHVLIVAAPRGIVHDNELYGCGHLELSTDGATVRKWRGPWFAEPLWPVQVENIIASIAVRRDHQTRYAGMRRFLKSYRARYSPVAAAGGGS